MNISKYMTFTVPYEKYIGVDDDFMSSSYAPPINIKCFVYGKNIYIRDEDSYALVSAKSYVTDYKINIQDKLDGQIVKNVDNYPKEWNSKNQLFEALIW